jgi:hypothetical protein
MIDYYVGQESLFMGDVSLESFNYGYNDKPFNNGLYMMEGSSSGQGGQAENPTSNSPNAPNNNNSDHPYIETIKKGNSEYKRHLAIIKEGKADADNLIHLCTLKNRIVPDFFSLKITLYEAFNSKITGVPDLAHNAYNHPEYKLYHETYSKVMDANNFRRFSNLPDYTQIKENHLNVKHEVVIDGKHFKSVTRADLDNYTQKLRTKNFDYTQNKK